MSDGMVMRQPSHLLTKSLEAVEARLVWEFSPGVDSGTVRLLLAREVQKLRSARVWEYVPLLAERATRQRLLSLKSVRRILSIG